MHPTQQKLLSYLENNDSSGKTLRQIAIDIGEKQQPQLIKHHLDQLIKKGFLRVQNGSYKLVEPFTASSSNQSLISIPILGTANCGPAELFAAENLQGYIKISRSLVPSNHKLFAMRTVGSSMNAASISGDSISEGDYVIVDPDDKDIRDGNYVLSIIDGLANIKRFFRDEVSKEIILRSESSAEAPPIVIDPDEVEYMVNGKVIRVIKQAA